MNKDPVRIAVLVSGGGTNLQAILDAQTKGVLSSGRVKTVIADRPGAYALRRAEQAGIITHTVAKKQYTSQEAFENALLTLLKQEKTELIVLAGFLSVLSRRFTDAYPKRILNVHPSLIPSFCGDGFYGLRVHEAALARGVKVTGATVHFVNEITDGGEIIIQKAVRVLPGDTPEKLQRRVMKQAEWIILPKAAEMVCRSIQGGNKV